MSIFRTFVVDPDSEDVFLVVGIEFFGDEDSPSQARQAHDADGLRVSQAAVLQYNEDLSTLKVVPGKVQARYRCWESFPKRV